MTGPNGFHHSDPLLLNADHAQRDLFLRMTQLCNGRNTDQVLAASLNMIVNALRQTYPTRNQAEARFDELAGRTKQILLDHYDSVTGKRRTVFPFTQVVQAAHVDDRDQMGRRKG